ncbi:hypothetical protein [Streptomyces sp. NRRL S-475]|uniref:hypothetical protein n=1 Tax=Streptomyces sp. NRRL S-475 TaxID=1463910 RepID=UPI0004C6734A|nr:hypothetical protein [Streptomyces sp. NRRL S-475]
MMSIAAAVSLPTAAAPDPAGGLLRPHRARHAGSATASPPRRQTPAQRLTAVRHAGTVAVCTAVGGARIASPTVLAPVIEARDATLR